MDKIRDPKFKALVFDFHGMLAADDEHGDSFHPAHFPHFGQNRKAVRFGHLQIQKKRSGFLRMRSKHFQCQCPIGGCIHQIFICQHVLKQFAVQFRILRDKNPLHINLFLHKFIHERFRRLPMTAEIYHAVIS